MYSVWEERRLRVFENKNWKMLTRFGIHNINDYRKHMCLVWEERRLRVFWNRILRRIFGPKRDANGKIHSLYHSPNIVRAIKSRGLWWAGDVARMEECRSAFKILTGTPAGKRPLGRPRHRWEKTILEYILKK